MIKMRKRYSLLIMGCISIAVISITASFYMPYHGEETSATIDSAKQLKISASEIGMGWEERDYMKNKRNGSSISGIGDEAVIYPRDGWLLRTSNAFIEVSFTRVEYEGKGEEGKIIAEKIVEKVRKWSKNWVD